MVIKNAWIPKGALVRGTQLMPGRLLAVRVRAAQFDLTLIVHAPLESSSGNADPREREVYWEALQSYLRNLPVRTAPYLEGISMAGWA